MLASALRSCLPTARLPHWPEFWTRRCLISICLVYLSGVSPFSSALAQECGSDYRIQAGDTLSKLAATVYGDADKWTAIYALNVAVIGVDPNRIEIGDVLRIACLDRSLAEQLAGDQQRESTPTEEAPVSVVEAESEADPAATGSADRSISLLTADGYEPFTDRSLAAGGLVTELLNAAIQESPGRPVSRVVWINDWSAHLDPLLSEHVYDAGFPWLQPDCATDPSQYRCREFLFSTPLFEMLVLLFTNRSQPLVFEKDEDMVGKTLCRPSGYYTHDLEKDGRLWLTNRQVTLEQPQAVDDCFRMLAEGKVDAVALNEFTGRAAVKRLSMEDQVVIVDSRPLSIEGLHVVVHKQHPAAAEVLEKINAGVAAIEANGRFQNIVERHLATFWSEIDGV